MAKGSTARMSASLKVQSRPNTFPKGGRRLQQPAEPPRNPKRMNGQQSGKGLV